MARSIMIQGTMSNAGKSVLTAGLLRVMKQDGYKVAPFKSQNMALNSYITENGLEMGRAQVMQAEAAGIEPTVHMNPILLKPTNDVGSQVIVNGEVVGVMSAKEYFRKKRMYIPDIIKAYETLEKEYDIIVIEGAGSPAEINLKENDIVNMGLAEMVDAPVLLVGDIDRGGVFAQIVGTILLLTEEERERIKGTVINKFRGDKEILKPGLQMLEEKSSTPVLGVIPYGNLDLDEEDSLTERFEKKKTSGAIDVAVIRFPRISNFTDFAVLEAIPEIHLHYVSSQAELKDPDAVLLPGSKDTIGDLLWMRQNGLEGAVLKLAGQGKLIFGICGGYQMLGEEISDPLGSEHKGSIRGMGLLPGTTVFTEEKKRTRVTGQFEKIEGILKGLSGLPLEGYEIHMGKTEGDGSLLRLQAGENLEEEGSPEGMQKGNIYGCYVHGIFDGPGIAEAFVKALYQEKGLDPSGLIFTDHKEYKERQYDLLADLIRQNLDMESVYNIIFDRKS